jgi:D-alanine--poly(phosphoribitol) ligase subunit 1
MQTNVLEYLEHTTARLPGQTAVSDARRSLNFADLRNASLTLAREIVSVADVTAQPVAVYLPKSIEAVASDACGKLFGSYIWNRPTHRKRVCLA